jgi:rhodanese-related sulfurtransferase
MSIFSQLFSNTENSHLQTLVSEGAFLVDVRTPAEFEGGHVKGSVNIPLDSIPFQLEKFKDKKNVIVFCRSGNRSGQAKFILEQNGITNVTNGGTWDQVNALVK